MIGITEALRASCITLPSPSVIERAGIAGRARARQRAYNALLAGVPAGSLDKLDRLLVVDPQTGLTPLAWLRDMATAPTPDNVRGLLDRLARVRDIGLPVTISDAIHPDRLGQLVREGRASPAQLIGRYTPSRRRATLAAMILDLEAKLIDAALDMADRIIGGSFTRGNNKQKKSYAATTRDVGRIMRLFDRTVAALAEAQENGCDAFAAVDAAVGWDKLLRARAEARTIADLADENPLVRAADQWSWLRKFAPPLLEAIDFKAGRGSASTIAAVNTLREMNRSGRRDVPPDAPMPFRKEWRTLLKEGGDKPDRRLWETGIMAHLRNKWRSGDVWVERSANYRKFDSYLLPSVEAAPIAAGLKLPATADEWLADRGRELDWRLKSFAHRLAQGRVEGVALKDGKLSIAPVRAEESVAAKALAARIDGLMPRVRITELLHEVARATGFPLAFTNVKTGEPHDNENALLAAILADGSNLGVARMADASQGVTPDQLVWTKAAYIAPDNYNAAARAYHRCASRVVDRGRMGPGHVVVVRRAVLPLGQARQRRGRLQRQIRRRSGLLLLHSRLRPARAPTTSPSSQPRRTKLLMCSTGCSIMAQDSRSTRTTPTAAARPITSSHYAGCSAFGSVRACATFPIAAWRASKHLGNIRRSSR